jgi:hypothetical protein
VAVRTWWSWNATLFQKWTAIPQTPISIPSKKHFYLRMSPELSSSKTMRVCTLRKLRKSGFKSMGFGWWNGRRIHLI